MQWDDLLGSWVGKVRAASSICAEVCLLMLDAGGGVNQVLEMQRQNHEVLVRSLASGMVY